MLRRMIKRTSGIVVLGVLAVAGCGGSSEPAADCIALDQAMLEQISDGLVDSSLTVESGAAVELSEVNQSFGYRYAVAVDVDDETPILASGSVDSGPLLAADHLARVYFTWGGAAEDDSPIGEWRDAMFVSDAAEAAAGCLG